MEQWQRVALILGIFGFLKDFRPSEPFVIEFLTDSAHNLTVEQVVQDVLPIGTYSYVTQLVVAFLITDYFRYKPLIIVSGLAGTVVWSLFIWSKSIRALQILEVFYGMYLAAEIAFYAYIYARVDKKHYQKITSYIRASTLAGRFLASTTSQLFIYFGITDYLGLNYISLAGMVLLFFYLLRLTIIQFQHNFRLRLGHSCYPQCLQVRTFIGLEEQIELKSGNHQADSETTCSRATTLLWSHFKCAYTNFTVIRYSLWNAVAVCFMNQIISYVQALWSTIGGPNTVLWNGAVEAVLTLMGSLVALLAGFVPQKYLALHITMPCLGMIAFLEGLALFIAEATSNLTVSYAGYIAFGIMHSFALTLVTSEIAKHISNDSFALIFGINTTIGLMMQSILTLAVVDNDGWFALDIRAQFIVYSYIFVAVGLIYCMFLMAELFQRRKPELPGCD